MQNKVDLTIADWMVYCCLVCLCDLTDLDQFTFFCSFLKRRKNGCFFLYAHIAVVSTVVIAGNCIQSMISIFCDKLCNIGSMKSGCCRNFPGACSFCPHLKCFQPAFCSLIFVFFASLLNSFDFFFTEFISGSHIHHPDIVYHIVANS